MSDRYPPPDHLLRDLQLRFERDGETLALTAPGPEALHNRAGSLGIAALGTAVDILGGSLSLGAVQPDWCLTASLGIRLVRPLHGEFRALGSILRAGRSSVVSETRVVEAGSPMNPPAAFAQMQFLRIPRRDGTPHFSESDDDAFRIDGEARRRAQPFFERLGCRVVDAQQGVVELDLRPYVRNSVGAVQGGAAIALADAAAEAVAAARRMEGVATTDLHIHYLVTGRVGPIRTRTEWLGGSASEAHLRVELIDRGAEERVVSVALLRLGRLDE